MVNKGDRVREVRPRGRARGRWIILLLPQPDNYERKVKGIEAGRGPTCVFRGWLVVEKSIMCLPKDSKSESLFPDFLFFKSGMDGSLIGLFPEHQITS